MGVPSLLYDVAMELQIAAAPIVTHELTFNIELNKKRFKNFAVNRTRTHHLWATGVQ